MSDPPSDPHPPLELDRLPALRIALVGVVTLAVITGAIGVAALWAIGGAPRLRPPGPVQPFAADRAAISGVLQTLIVPDATGPTPPKLGAAPQRFEWVDREQEILRMPVEEAMAWVVERER